MAENTWVNVVLIGAISPHLSLLGVHLECYKPFTPPVKKWITIRKKETRTYLETYPIQWVNGCLVAMFVGCSAYSSHIS